MLLAGSGSVTVNPAGKPVAGAAHGQHRDSHEPIEADGWPVTDVTVKFFKAGDPEFSFVALDGELIPKGPPLECFREELAKDGGVVKLPDGTSYPICIPEDISDGEGFRVYLAVTRMNPDR